MPDLLKEFLSRTDDELAGLEEILPRLEENPADENVWSALADLFLFVRGTAPFLGFGRSHALSEAALAEIADYRSGRRGLEVLPPILMKFRRLRKIASSAMMLGREPRETDADLLPESQKTDDLPSPREPEAMPAKLWQTAKLLSAKEKKIREQEASLDGREEELVVWSQSLADQEAALKERENRLFEGEKKILLSENDLSSAFVRLREKESEIEAKTDALAEQEKESLGTKAEMEEQNRRLTALKAEVEQAEALRGEREEELRRRETELLALEEELAQSRIELQDERKSLDKKEAAQAELSRRMEEKERNLQASAAELRELEEGLRGKAEMNQHLETELRLQIQQLKQQAADSENTLREMNSRYSDAEAQIDELSIRCDEKQRACDEAQERLAEERREIEKMQLEWADQIKRYRLLKEKAAVLENDLSFQTMQTRHAEKSLLRQTEMYETLQETLKAVSWPPDTLEIQKDIVDLVRSRAVLRGALGESHHAGVLSAFRNAVDAAEGLTELLMRLRSRPLRETFRSLETFAARKAEKYRRPFTLDIECAEGAAADLEAEEAIRQILTRLCDNSLRYAVSADASAGVGMRVSAADEGALLRIVFSDSGTSFPLEDLRRAVRQAGLVPPEKAEEMNGGELMPYLFHPSVMRQSDMRGLLASAKILEKVGGRIEASFSEGFHVAFVLPKYFLLGPVLVFETAGTKFVLPLAMVVETFALDGVENRMWEEGGFRFMERGGRILPIMELPVDIRESEPAYGIVVRTGVFSFLLPVRQVFDAERAAAFFPDRADRERPFMMPCVTLESGADIPMLDMSFLLRLYPLPLAADGKEEEVSEIETARPAPSVSFLIFKGAPDLSGAVPIECVERIDAFTGCGSDGTIPAADGERKLPLRDFSGEPGFPYARAVLLLKEFGLAVQEVVDIADIIPENTGEDFIVYEGARIPLLNGKP